MRCDGTRVNMTSSRDVCGKCMVSFSLLVLGGEGSEWIGGVSPLLNHFWLVDDSDI